MNIRKLINSAYKSPVSLTDAQVDEAIAVGTFGQLNDLAIVCQTTPEGFKKLLAATVAKRMP